MTSFSAAAIDRGIQIQTFPRFKPVDIDDQTLIRRYAETFSPLSCEYCFTNLYCWQTTYDLTWTVYRDRLIVYDATSGYAMMPLGDTLAPDELVRLSRQMKSQGMTGSLALVPPEYLILNPSVQDSYTVNKHRDSADYIYSVERLVELSGKKLQKKKNLVTQFHRLYPGFTVRQLDKSHLSACVELAQGIANAAPDESGGLTHELMALRAAADAFDRLGLEGVIISVEGKTVAFSIVSRLNSLMADIHFEKADYRYKGAAQVINHETARLLKGRYLYVNREQDLGIPGLRQAKTSYDPELIYATYTLDFNG